MGEVYIYNGLRSIYHGIFNTTRLLPIFSRENRNKKFYTRDAHGSIIGLYFISFGNGRINLEENLKCIVQPQSYVSVEKCLMAFFFFSKVTLLLTFPLPCLSTSSPLPSTVMFRYRTPVNVARPSF